MSRQNSNSPFYRAKVQNYPLLESIFYKRSLLRSQTFLIFRTLHLAYPKLVGTPCICLNFNFDTKTPSSDNFMWFQN